MLKAGDICTFRQENGAWGYFWVLAVDNETIGDVYSLSKFSVQSDAEVLSADVSSIEELKTFELLGHFPITSEQVQKANPKVIGYMQVKSSDLKGYRVWRKAFDENKAGVFTIPLDRI